MSDVPAIGNVPTYDPSVQAPGSKALGKDEFLSLLVTQLRFQNPLEPLKDTDFIAQLAQFSSLEQLSNIKTSLDNSTQLNYVLSQTIANTMATTLIGKEVVADSNQIYHAYDGSDDLHFDLGKDAKEVEVKIYDEKGALVRTITIDDLHKGMNSVVWDGKDDARAKLTAGNYTYSVTAKDQAGNAVSVQTRRVGIVESVRYEDGQGYLIVDGQKIALSDVVEVNLNRGGSEHDS